MRGPLGLPIGAALVLPIRARVPIEPEPPQILDQRRGVGFAAALSVRVLDAQDEAASQMPPEEEVEEGRPRISEVQLSRGAGGKTSRTARTERWGSASVHSGHGGHVTQIGPNALN